MALPCLIDTGLGRPACPGETPGAYDTLWLFNREEVVSYTPTGATNVIEAIVWQAGKGLIQYVGRKGSIVAREEKQDTEGNSTDYTHEVDVHFADLSPEARDAIQDLNAATLGAIVRTKGDRYILLGYNQGLEMKVNNMTTAAEGLGEFLTLREVEVNEKTRRFFKTSPTVTLTTIAGYVVAS